MNIISNRYNGITIDSSTLPDSNEIFIEKLKNLLNSTEGKQLVWVKIPAEKSEFIPILTRQGFEFHHCDENGLMLVKKLVEAPVIPTPKNFTVGVGAIVRAGNNLLVIKDQFEKGYKLPGGHVEKSESLKTALQREVLEETGVVIEFESIMNLGHFMKGQFDESILYIVCTAKPVSKEITIKDTSEIIEARWIDVNEFLNSSDTNNYNKSVVEAALKNKELKLTEQKVQLRVKEAEVFY